MGFFSSLPPLLLGAASYICLGNALLYKKDTDILSIIFLLTLPLSIILASPDAVFKSWQRLLFFLPIFLLGSPIFTSLKFERIRKASFRVYIIVFAILSVVSFFCYFFGISLQAIRSEDIDEFMYQTGYFSGITRHSMMLGPLSGIASIYFFFQSRKGIKNVYTILTIICLGSTLFSASRGAFIGTCAGIVYIIYSSSYNTLDFFRKSGIIVLFATITFSAWGGALKGIQEKGMHRRTELGEYDSRTEKYYARVDEFCDSPIWGVGFSAINPYGKDKYQEATGIIEPGSSWLGVLSMTGLLGFSLFFLLYYRSFKVVHSNNKNPLLAALLIMMGVHWTIEGYIFAAGNPFCYFSWLLLGYAYDKRSEDVESIEEDSEYEEISDRPVE